MLLTLVYRLIRIALATLPETPFLIRSCNFLPYEKVSCSIFIGVDSIRNRKNNAAIRRYHLPREAFYALHIKA